MFYRIVALGLVALGIYEILSHLSLPFDITPDSLEKSAIGLATVFIGLLNWIFVYESPESHMPRIILLSANIVFIGFAILLITSTIDPFHGYAALGLSLVNCIMVLNHKV